MKKIFLTVLALSLVSTSAVYANPGKGKKAKKAKIVTTQCCEAKDCKKTATCTPMPGCGN